MTKLRQFDWSNFRFFFFSEKKIIVLFFSHLLCISGWVFHSGDLFFLHVCLTCLPSIVVLLACPPCSSHIMVHHVCLPLLAFMLLIRFSTPRVLLMLAFHFCHPFVSVIFPIHVRLFGLSTMLCLLSHSSFQPIVRTGTLRMCTSIPTNQPTLMIPQVTGVCACLVHYHKYQLDNFFDFPALIRTGDLSI